MPSVSGGGESFAGAFRNAVKSVSLGSARPSYRAKSPRAQFRQLERTAAGRRALEAAGVGGNKRTRGAWLTGTRAPSKANAAAIGRAYSGMQQGGIPDWVKRGTMHISGDIGMEARGGVRHRGTGGDSALEVRLSAGLVSPEDRDRFPQDSIWDAIEENLDDDDDLEELIGDLIGEDLNPSDYWSFPGGGYTVVITG